MTILVLFAALMLAPPSRNMLQNPSFASGLDAWRVQGAVAADRKQVTLGPGKASVSQRYDVPGLRILYVAAKMEGAGALLRMRCFDGHDHPLFEMTATPNDKHEAGIYTKTQAFTRYVVVSLENQEGKGTVSAGEAVLNDDDRTRVAHESPVDHRPWMQPIWKGQRVLDESVLLLSQNGEPPSGKLMFAPKHVQFVRSWERHEQYAEGVDFVVKGSRIQALPGSKIPTMKASEFATGQYPWTDLSGRHIFVSYDHDDAWPGPTPDRQGNLLPRTADLLSHKQPVTIAALGDSITLGMFCSGYRQVAPFQPPWATLFAHELSRRNGDEKIHLYNAAVGGTTSDWGLQVAPDCVGALHPDLVLLAFGMNDFWSLTPAQFRKNIEGIMRAVREKAPQAEFILIASIKFNPDYTHEPTYVGNLSGYAGELEALKGPGVAVLNMTKISDALYKAKSAPDLQTDPMHPDDFLARWYAQGLIETLEHP